MPFLVSPVWLRERLAAPAATPIRLLDATYYLPNEAKDAAALFQAAHLPGARFFDIDKVVDAGSPLPHMLPTAQNFAAAVAALGVSSTDHVVVYDQRGLFSAARLWWMFRVFGHDNVSVLDGGLPGWIEAGGAVESGAPAPAIPGHFVAGFRPELVRSLDQMKANLQNHAELVLDARAAGRFDGSVPEPRPGMRSGHIPGAKSLPFTELLQDGKMLPPESLRAKFAGLGVTPDSQLVTSCGSGVTAAVLTLGLAVAGLPQGALYDGSWSEWGSRNDTPIEV
ncbi:3-mercaptopyruvate sulfurtransferase [Acidocella sp.]|jgi:thiosulfate/3-mercaptopyruvate sulfurtransferase|uniref:3-mercaptopyruvate sulfurtransferase n=1 Tax=Acidocella sp. TaxID=50710 RepID=UPI002F40521D